MIKVVRSDSGDLRLAITDYARRVIRYAIDYTITARIGNRLKGGGKSPSAPKNSITYERESSPEGIKEKIKVEIGEHFKDNDNFEKYLEVVKKNLTDKNELPDRKPVPAEVPKDNNTAHAIMLFGNTITLAGLALMVKALLPILL